MRRWRTGFDIPISLAGWAPAAALVAAGVGVVVNTIVSDGDIRDGVFPWAMALAALGLTGCCLGILRVHGPRPSPWILIGGWWTAAAFLGVAGFFAAVGVGAILGIDEEDAGALAWVAVTAMAFGLLSMTPALAVLSLGIRRAGVLPAWALAAAWVATPLVPLLLIFGGATEGTVETVGMPALLVTFAAAWVVIGVSLLGASGPLGVERPNAPPPGFGNGG